MAEAKQGGEQDGGKGAEPSGPKGDSAATAGKGETEVHSTTTENRKGQINPSSPEDANTTPGTTADEVS